MTSDQILLIQSALSGIMVGSLFGIIAMGLSLTWGILKIANFAHLSYALLGAYLSYTLIAKYGIEPLLTTVIVVPSLFIIGVGVQWLFETFKVTTFTSLLLTFGMFMVLENVITYIWTADTVTTRRLLPTIYRRAIRFPEPFDTFFVLPPDLLAFIAAVVLGGGIYWLLHHTQWGRAVRAMAEDPLIAQAYGVNYRREALLLSGLATATAGFAGVIIAIKMSLFPALPLTWIGIVVAAVILGGLGNPIGAIVAACALLAIQNIWSVKMQPSWAPLISFGLFIFYLIVQPFSNGLLTKLKRKGK